MSCEEFRDRMMEYIEEELSSSEMEEMKEHINTCSHCREAYERRLEIICGFDEVLNEEGISFNSRKSNIMDSIDKSRYKKPPVNRFKQIIINNKKYMAQAAVAILIIAIIPAVLKSTGVIGTNRDLAKKSAGGDGIVNSLESEEGIGIESYTEGQRNEDSNLQTEGIMEDAISSKLMALREDNSLELKPWTLEYASTDKIVFSNYNNIVVYSQTQQRIISFIKLDNLKAQEAASKLELKVSADGNYAFVGAYREKGQILLLSLSDGSYRSVGSGSLEDVKVSWSTDSNWAAFYDEENKQLLIFDILGNGTLTLNDKLKEPMENIYISNKGDLSFQGKESYVLKAPDYTQSILLLGRAIGFKDGNPLSIKEGNIYYNSEKGAENFMALEGNYESSDFYQQGDKLLFTSQGAEKLLDLNSKAITEDYQADSTEKPDIGDFISQVNYIDEDTLVYVALIDNPNTIGQFRIVKYSIKTREKTVLYDNSI